MDGCGVNLLTGAIFELVGPSGGFGRTIFSQFAMTAVPSTPIKPMMATITSVLGGFLDATRTPDNRIFDGILSAIIVSSILYGRSPQMK
jgi:hypothetical protein